MKVQECERCEGSGRLSDGMRPCTECDGIGHHEPDAEIVKPPFGDMLDKWLQHLPHSEQQGVGAQLERLLVTQRDEGIDLGRRLHQEIVNRLERQVAHYQAVAQSEREAHAEMRLCYQRLSEDLENRNREYQACDNERLEFWRAIVRQDNNVKADNTVMCPRTAYHCYRVPPMDEWGGVLTLTQYCDSLQGSIEGEQYASACVAETKEIFSQVEHRCREKLGWQGNFVQGPFAVSIPVRGGTAAMFMWEQIDAAFVCSPKPLVWLEDEA